MSGERRARPSVVELAAWVIARLTGVTRTGHPGEYAEQARARAAVRRSPWNLLLVPLVLSFWLLLAYGSARGLGALYAAFHPEARFVLFPDGLAGVLMSLGSLLAWLAPSMIIANGVAWLVRPARRAFEREALGHPDLTFAAANRGLLRMSTRLTTAGLVMGITGAVLS